jgi:hypothetical protein
MVVIPIGLLAVLFLVSVLLPYRANDVVTDDPRSDVEITIPSVAPKSDREYPPLPAEYSAQQLFEWADSYFYEYGEAQSYEAIRTFPLDELATVLYDPKDRRRFWDTARFIAANENREAASDILRKYVLADVGPPDGSGPRDREYRSKLSVLRLLGITATAPDIALLKRLLHKPGGLPWWDDVPFDGRFEDLDRWEEYKNAQCAFGLSISGIDGAYAEVFESPKEERLPFWNGETDAEHRLWAVRLLNGALSDLKPYADHARRHGRDTFIRVYVMYPEIFDHDPAV